MIDSKLVGKSLPEIIHMIVFEEIIDVNYHDGEYMEMLLQGYENSDSTYELEDIICDLEMDISKLEDKLDENEDYIKSLEQLLEENGIEY